MGHSAVPLAGTELLRAWEAASSVPPARRGAAVLDAVLMDLPTAAELLPVGSCDTLLLALRVGTFGGQMSGLTACASCGAEVDLDVDAAAILASLPEVDLAELEPDSAVRGEYVVSFRLPTSADLLACADSADPTDRILARCITAATHAGSPVEIGALPADVLAAAADAMAAVDRAADLRLRAECPTCGAEYSARLDVADFFVAELTSAAQTLIGEIDELASRYGWGESEILGLSPTRRRSYLELR